MNDQGAFEEAVKQSPDDQALRLVYADWLEEHDQPEEALRQRKFLDAKKWLTDLAATLGMTCDNYSDIWHNYFQRTQGVTDEERRRIGDEAHNSQVWRPVSYDDLLQAGVAYAKAREIDSEWGWDGFTQMGEECVRDTIRGKLLDEYWDNWEVLTGLVRPAKDEHNGSPFSCSC
jgi:uncharacterized protein (TIGR02996 family)